MLIAANVGEDVFRAVLQGTPPGAVFALIALGFVLTYKTSGVFNLAFGAQAYVSAAMYFKAKVEWEWPTFWAFFISVILLAPAIGLLLERIIFRHLRTAPAVAKLVVAIGLTVAIPALFELLAGFEAVAGQTPQGILPDGASVFYDPFGVYPWSRNELAQLLVAVTAMLLLGAMFRYSSIGLSMRAVVESPRLAELAGVNSNRVSSLAWGISSLFAGLSGVLIAPRFNTLAAPDFFNIMVVAIAAAAIGKLVSLPWAVVGGLGLGITISLFTTFLPRWSDDLSWLRPFQENLTPSLPFVVLFGIMVLWPGIRQSIDSTDPLSGVDPPPPGLASSARSKRLTNVTRVTAILIIGICAFWVFAKADVGWMFLVTQAVIMSTIFLSITVITGFAGQISLCQASFAAMGGFAVFQLADRWDIPVLLGALIGAAIAAAVGALLALPILRLGGVWFAIATLAFAFFFDSVMIKFSWVGGGDTSLLQGTRVDRPDMFGIDFNNDKSFLLLVIVVFIIASFLVVRVREGTVGRTLQALRGSEVAAESIGISPVRVRVTAFALSAAIAGLGGSLLTIQQENVNYAGNFAPFAGLFWTVLVVTLSARTVEGAVMAGVSFGLFERAVLRNVFQLSGKWRFVLFGLAASQYARHPEGILEYGKGRSFGRLDALLDRWDPRSSRSGDESSSESEEPTVDGDSAADVDGAKTGGTR
ncbi:MAG: ABC transporter permease [Ilumatobacteraceae bacterium]|nr:ABC transporter permease [Ilumatobacteraceae bacterium]